MKKCLKCLLLKEDEDFGKCANTKSGKHTQCKFCRNKKAKEYHRSKVGLVAFIYSHQKQSSKKRGHKPPKYTRLELEAWVFNQSNFDLLFETWKSSNYKKNKKPSIDRLNNKLGYSFNNIQLVTWKENNEKAYKVMEKVVLQYSSEGVFIKEFPSVQRVVDTLDLKHQNVSAACRGNQKTAGGFIWKYKT